MRQPVLHLYRFISFVLAAGCVTATDESARKLDTFKSQSSSELLLQLENDRVVSSVYQKGIKTILIRLKKHAGLRSKKIINSEEKNQIRAIWARMLDYTYGVDSLSLFYSRYESIKNVDVKTKYFSAFYQMYISQYKLALDFIEATENIPAVDLLLNEGTNKNLFPEKSFAEFKYRFLHFERAVEYLTLRSQLEEHSESHPVLVSQATKADEQTLMDSGTGRGLRMTLKNGLDIISRASIRAWMPVQTGVSEWMGDTKIRRKHEYLITDAQVVMMQKKLLPGDIIFSRKEWYLSNIGLPGFWPHASLYIGAPQERTRFFGTSEVKRWLKKYHRSENLETLLRKNYEKSYLLSLSPAPHGGKRRVLEAISEGVSFTSLSYVGHSDSLAVLRPRLSVLERAKAILRSFKYAGRPYDFNFDFSSDDSLVCSELVFKSYETSSNQKGIKFPVESVLGRSVSPPNLMVQAFDRNFKTQKQQLDLVLFLDGKEDEGIAVEAGVQIILIDEITAVFDPEARQYFMRELKELSEKGVGIVVATNIVTDVQDFVDRLLILKGGKLAVNISPENAKES